MWENEKLSTARLEVHRMKPQKATHTHTALCELNGGKISTVTTIYLDFVLCLCEWCLHLEHIQVQVQWHCIAIVVFSPLFRRQQRNIENALKAANARDRPKRWAFILEITLCTGIVQRGCREMSSISNSFHTNFASNKIYGQRMMICATFFCVSFFSSGSRFLFD